MQVAGTATIRMLVNASCLQGYVRLVFEQDLAPEHDGWHEQVPGVIYAKGPLEPHCPHTFDLWVRSHTDSETSRSDLRDSLDQVIATVRERLACTLTVPEPEVEHLPAWRSQYYYEEPGLIGAPVSLLTGLGWIDFAAETDIATKADIARPD